MRKNILISILTLLVFNANTQTSWPYPYVIPNTDWINYYSQRDAMGSAPGSIDANSNVYSTGFSGLSTASNLVALKYDSTGILQYAFNYNNGAYDIGNAIKVDAVGNAYVAGISTGTVGSTGRDYIIIKLNSSGVSQWVKRYDRAVNNIDEAADLCIDASGDVFVTGKSKNSSGNFDIVTLKLNGSNGNIIWTHVYSGSGLDDVGTGIVLSSNGSYVYITGNTTNSVTGSNIVTYALNASNGTSYWSPIVTNGTSNGSDKSNAIIFSNGNLIICGETTNSTTGVDFTTIKYNGSNGSILWQDSYDYINSNNRATALARDSAGNIGVVGTALNGSVYEYHTVFYSNSGTRYAVNIESTGLSTSNNDPSVCNDTIAHHWYIAGEKMKNTKDIFVYQIAPSGNTAWRKTIDGQNNDIDAATSVVVNGIGVVYVGALSKNSSANYDYTTIKINQTPVYFPVNYNFVTDTFSHSNLFYPQTNEILETTGNVASDVLYYTKFAYPNQYILKDRVSFCELKEGASSSPSVNDTLNRVDMIFLESNKLTEPYPLNSQDICSINYFKSHMGTGGKTNVRGASHLLTPNIYPYIDLVYTSNSEGSKYFFVVKPGGNPSNILLQFQGTTSTNISGGNLIITTALGSWKFMKPRIYNVALNFTTMALTTPTVSGTNGWASASGNKYMFNPGTYNSSFPLVIEFDMGVATSAASSSLNCEWSTYVGGANNDLSFDIVSDSQDNLFTMGSTTSNNFPLVTGVSVYQNSQAGSKDGFIDKYNNLGKRLWSTFIGGVEDDITTSLDVASNGDIYAVGLTQSTLTTLSKLGATNYNSPLGGEDLFVMQLSSNGQQLKWLTYYGGNGDENVAKCKFDGNGNLFVVGRTIAKNIPIIGSSPQYTNTNNDVIATTEGFIAKYNTSSSISWATYLGSSVNGTVTSSDDGLFNLDFDSNNDLYVVGYANGMDYPNITNGSSTNYSHYNENNSDATISRFYNSGQIKWSTNMGGNGPDAFYGVKISNNKIYATGYKTYTGYPLVNSNNWYYSTNTASLSDAVLSIWNNNNVLIHSTAIAGNGNHVGYDIDVDNADIIYIGGQTNSSAFPANVSQASNAYVDSYKGADDNFLFAIAPSHTNIVWATDIGGTGSELYFFGGGFIDVNSQNILHMTGITTSSTLFPLFNGIAGTTYFDGTFNSGVDYTITRFSLYPVNLINGVEEKHNDIAEFRVYPNPTQSIINVKIRSEKDPAFYYIYDTSGKMVKEGKIETETNSINVSELPQGIYIMKVEQNNKTTSVKFIRNE